MRVPIPGRLGPQRRDILSMKGRQQSVTRDYETPGGSGTIYLTFEKVS